VQQLLQYTAAQWTANNTTLFKNQFGQETDTLLFKVGDGATAWNDLEYSGKLTNIAGLMQLQYYPNYIKGTDNQGALIMNDATIETKIITIEA